MKQPKSGRVVIPRNGHVAKVRLMRSGPHKVPGDKSRAQTKQEMKEFTNKVDLSINNTPEFMEFKRRWENPKSETPRIIKVDYEDDAIERANRLNCVAHYLGYLAPYEVFVVLDDSEADLLDEIRNDFDKYLMCDEDGLVL